MRAFTIFILTTLLTTLPLSANDNDMSDKELALQTIQENTPEFPNQEQKLIQESIVSTPGTSIEIFYTPISSERFLQTFKDSWLNHLEDHMLKKIEAELKEKLSQSPKEIQQILLESVKPTIKMTSTRTSTVLPEVLPARSYPARFIVITNAIFSHFFAREILNHNNSLIRGLFLTKEMFSNRTLSFEQKRELLRRISNIYLEFYSIKAPFGQMLRDLSLSEDPEFRQVLEQWERREKRFLEEAAQKSYDVALQTVLSSSQANNPMEFVETAVSTYAEEIVKHIDEWAKTFEKAFENTESLAEFKEKSQRELGSCHY